MFCIFKLIVCRSQTYPSIVNVAPPLSVTFLVFT